MKHEIELSDGMRDAIRSSIEGENYTNAIRDAFLYLSNVIRDKADCEGDGDRLVSDAFGGDRPKIQITTMESEGQRKEQNGFAQLLRGLYLTIRNPRSHDQISDQEADAIKVIAFLDWTCSRILGSQGTFSVGDFIKAVSDDDFVAREDYADALWEMVPKRKRFDYAIALYRSRAKMDVRALHVMFESWYSQQDESASSAFIAIMADDLRTTEDDGDRRSIVQLVQRQMWSQFDTVSRLRTERRILKSIEEGKTEAGGRTTGGWFCTWCTHLFPAFSDARELLNAIGAKVSSSDLEEVRFATTHLLKHAWGLFDQSHIESLASQDVDAAIFSPECDFPLYVAYKIKDGSKVYRDLVIRQKQHMSAQLWDMYTEVLENFQEDASTDPTDPVRFDDDVPF